MDPRKIDNPLHFIAGCACKSTDGFTYLNDDCRAAIKQAAKDFDDLKEEVERLKRLMPAAS